MMHYVEIVDRFDDENIIERIGPFQDKRVDQVAAEKERNIDKEKYYVRIIDSEKDEGF